MNSKWVLGNASDKNQIIDQNADELRKNLLQVILILTSAALLPLVIARYDVMTADGWHPAQIVIMSSHAGVWILALLHRRLPLKVSSTLLLLMWLSAATLVLTRAGLVGFGPTILITASVFAAAFLGARVGMATVVYASLLHLLVAWRLHSGLHQFFVDPLEMQSSPSFWLMRGLTALLVMGVLVYTFGQIMAWRRQALDGYRIKQAELHKANERLHQEAAARRAAETRANELNVELELRVQERTAQLTLANEQLARASRTKDEFLATMSHELRTPLSAVMGKTELLQEGVYGHLTKVQNDTLAAIYDAGEHLLSLITDVLDFAKSEVGELKLETRPVAPYHVCHASEQLVKVLAVKKHIQLSVDVDERVQVVKADPRRLKQILVNLLGNAIKFTPEDGQVGIEVAADPAQGQVHFTVWDTGIGIPQDKMHLLFEPFRQLDNRLSRAHEGTGLGLALVAGLTKLHNGEVSVTSEVGVGSRFTVTLPWQPSDPSDLDAVASVAADEAERSPLILLADDNPHSALTLTDFLGYQGYDVLVAGNGAEALTMARSVRPDLVLMDMFMPEMDGLEATQQFRQDPELQDIPIIGMTAMTLGGHGERFMDAGVDVYLPGPVELKTLKVMVVELLTGAN